MKSNDESCALKKLTILLALNYQISHSKKKKKRVIIFKNRIKFKIFKLLKEAKKKKKKKSQL